MTWSEIMGVLKRLDNNLSNAVYLQRLLHSWAKEISPRSSSGEGREPFAKTSKRGARPCPQCDRTSIDAEAINTVTAILIPICQYAPAISPRQERTEPSGHRSCRYGAKSPRREPEVPGDLLRAQFGNVTEPGE
jgi:hypothetical protein